MLTVLASDVTVDLRGRSLESESLGLGVVRSWRYVSNVDQGSRRQITVRNGTIRSRNSFGVLLDDLFNSEWVSFKDELPGHGTDTGRNFAWGKVETPLGKFTSAFPRTEHRVESLRITVGEPDQHINRRLSTIGVGMKGGGNVIRDTVIEVTEGNAGIYLYGPDQVIENCTIVFRGSGATPRSALIKLHAGNRSIIRNNKLIVEGGEAGPQQAISLIGSKDVVVEGNTVQGVKQLVKTWDADSSAIERNNSSKAASLF